MARKPRVRVHRTVKPETRKLLSKLAEHLDLTEGQALDRAVQALAVAESFGSNHLNLRSGGAFEPERSSLPCEYCDKGDVPYQRNTVWLHTGGVTCPRSNAEETAKILTGPGNTITRTQKYLEHLESQSELKAQRDRVTNLDATGIDRSSKTGKASLVVDRIADDLRSDEPATIRRETVARPVRKPLLKPKDRTKGNKT